MIFKTHTKGAVEGKSETSLSLILSSAGLSTQNPPHLLSAECSKNNLQFLSHLYIYIEIYTETYKI